MLCCAPGKPCGRPIVIDQGQTGENGPPPEEGNADATPEPSQGALSRAPSQAEMSQTDSPAEGAALQDSPTLESVLAKTDTLLILDPSPDDTKTPHLSKSPDDTDGSMAYEFSVTDNDQAVLFVGEVQVSGPDPLSFNCALRPAGSKAAEPVLGFASERQGEQNWAPGSVTIDGKLFGTMRSKPRSWTIAREDVDTMATAYTCCQPRSGAVVCAVLLCVPTLALGTCGCLWYATHADHYLSIRSLTPGGPRGKLWERRKEPVRDKSRKGRPPLHAVHLDMKDWDVTRKKELLSIALYLKVCEWTGDRSPQ